MLSADSFLTLFLGLELMSLPVYVMVLLAYRRPQSAEAALKYLVLGGAATATLLMGVSLLYGADRLAGARRPSPQRWARRRPDGASPAAVLVLLAFFLKAAIVPFHAWAPDAYEGASVPVTAYMAAIVKAGVLLAAVRLFGEAKAALADAGSCWRCCRCCRSSGATWRRCGSRNLRRMMAYSSIAHAGYLFFACSETRPGVCRRWPSTCSPTAC